MTLRPLSALATVLTTVLVVGGAAVPADAAADDPVVTGYALPSTPSRVVARDASGLDTVTVASTSLRADGASLTPVPRGARRLLESAHRHDLRAELLVGNYSDRLEDFDPRALHRMLSSARSRRAVVRAVVAEVRARGWDGVNVDVERIRAEDAKGLVRLVSRLQTRLPDRARVSIDVSARTSLAAYRSAGYRLGALAAHVDLVQLMTYDQHGPTWTGPGPIGALDWQRRALETAAAHVPAERLDVGVAGYGYTWPESGTGRSLTVAQARRWVERDGGDATWEADAGEWTATLSDGTVLWWSDARSLELRRGLAAELGLHGLAVWRLGSADPLAAAP